MHTHKIFSHRPDLKYLGLALFISLLMPTTSVLAVATADCNGGTASIECGINANASGDFSIASGVNSSADGDSSWASSFGSVSLGFAAGFNDSIPVIDSPRGHCHRSSIKYWPDVPGAIAIGGDVDADEKGAEATAVGAIALEADVVNDVPYTMLINVPLRIEGTDNQLLLLENMAGTNATRRLIKMTNIGPVGFEMVDTNLGDTWQFRSDSVGKFVMNKLGNATTEFNIDGDGNAIFTGEVKANGILLTSSRESKTDITTIKPTEVMEKLKLVEIAEWRYKKAGKNDRHISPMAEDFYSLFKLGRDGKSINPNDLASVAILAAKELQKKSDAVDAKTAELEIKNRELKARLSSLEILVTNLALGQDLLPKKGDKVVLK